MTEKEAERAAELVGDSIRLVMQSEGVTYRELSERSGVSDSTLQNVLSGRRFATLWTLIRIRDALGCTWKDLMGDDWEECTIRMAHPDMGGNHEYVCGVRRVPFRHKGEMSFCPLCGRRANVRS